jgi:hypothetical protein
MIPPTYGLGYRLFQGMPVNDAGALGYGDNLLSRHVFQILNLPARPPDFQAIHHGPASEAKV